MRRHWGTMDRNLQDFVIAGRGLTADTGAAFYLIASDWDKADFRLVSFRHPDFHQVAANVKVTGRTVQLQGDARVVRVRITAIGDGEPNVSFGGYLYIDSMND